MRSRLAAVVLAVATAVLLVPGVAAADQPAGDVWGGAESFYTPLYVVLVFVGGPVALFLLVTVLGSLGRHRTYPRPTLGEEAQIEASEARGESVRRSTGLGDDQEVEEPVTRS